MKLQMKIIDPRIGTPGFPVPARQTPESAGIDLMAMVPETLTLNPGDSAKIGAGVAIYLKDPNFVGFVIPRSGMGSKGFSLKNTIGVIDADYQGELLMMVKNTGEAPLVINPGDRVAQYVVVPVALPGLDVVETFDTSTHRGTGGFGSTGTAS